ncbi:MAG: thiolase family protein [Anaerolineales bacterium]|nr:thiolase family protein [Anaerolineales bacterium]
MAMQAVFIPYGGYWCTPFTKWQGSFASLHPLTFAAEITRRALAERQINAAQFDALYLGLTVPARGSFYGAPWLAALIGAPRLTGPTLAQACATSARLVGSAAAEVEAGEARAILCVAADRTSNGPHLLYPNPLGPGGRGEAEDWVWDNFNCDPFAGQAMLATAENVAREAGLTTEAQHGVALQRYAQYQEALRDDAAFQRRYMVTPIEVNPTGRKVTARVTGDEGVFPTTAEGLAKLKPVLPGGTVTYGGQTYPADGNAGLIICSQTGAAELSRDRGIEVRVVSFAQGRATPGYMPAATVPAAQRALARAEIGLGEVKAIKTHNPFAVNDLYLAQALGLDLAAMNNYGSSLIWGHPQAPTGLRLIMELIEELVLLGGGYGLFTGCAAGDTAAAVVVKVGA